MRVVLFLLISLCLIGCNSPVSENADPIDLVEDELEEIDDLDKFIDSLTLQQQMELLVYADAMEAWDARGRVEPEPVPPDWLKPYLDKASSAASVIRSWPTNVDGFPVAPDFKHSTTLPPSSEPQGLLGPDPLADAQPEINGLKGAARNEGVWINFYYFPSHPLCQSELTRLKGWANERGLTVASASDANFRYAKVRLVDITKDKVNRNLVYDGNTQALYPTLVMVDQRGGEFCHNIGYINLHHLSEDYDKFSRTPSKRKLGVAALEPEDYRVEDPVTYECGPNGCRIVRRGK